MNETLEYYQNNAQAFVEQTQNVDFSPWQRRFVSRLRQGARILDLGCGSGRDTRWFLEHGFDVEAMDGCPALCEIASAYCGIPVTCQMFEQVDAVEQYDGIWACASLLHLTPDAFDLVMTRLVRALKNGACLYMSFKYGRFCGIRNERYFRDMDETLFQEWLKTCPDLTLDTMEITRDVRPERSDEKWLNLFLTKLASR